MTEDREYNGWTNWDTWAFALWVDNEESSYRARRELLNVASSANGLHSLLEIVAAATAAAVATDLLELVETCGRGRGRGRGLVETY